MSALDAVLGSLATLRANPLRSLLTMGGLPSRAVIIGNAIRGRQSDGTCR